ncbi:hypothetical protein [Nonomuraea sp. NPDC046570]|uniref:hypothetical protein n=1 Tax=Nonomuraea sp. NPDC046570 TaxID=3155255 RepID=UPI0033E1848B
MKWGAAVLRVRRVACAGAIVMCGLVGCTAEAASPTGGPTTTGTGTATGTAVPTATRQNIDVRLNPERVTVGSTSTVWILANCPVPSSGAAHTATATSRAFVSAVTLDPVPPPTSTAAPTSTTAAAVPWVRGDAQVAGTVKRGTYDVSVKCEGTNDAGTAKLRVVAEATSEPEPEPTRTTVPTKPPKAGGGGTFAKDAEQEQSLPLGPAGVLIAIALAGGAGLALRRRSRS